MYKTRDTGWIQTNQRGNTRKQQDNTDQQDRHWSEYTSSLITVKFFVGTTVKESFKKGFEEG